MKKLISIIVIALLSVGYSSAKEKVLSPSDLQKVATFVADGEIISVTKIEEKKNVGFYIAKFKVVTPFKGDRNKGEIWEIKFSLYPENYEGGRVPEIKEGDKFRLYADNISILGREVTITLNRNSVKYKEFGKGFSE